MLKLKLQQPVRTLREATLNQLTSLIDLSDESEFVRKFVIDALENARACEENSFLRPMCVTIDVNKMTDSEIIAAGEAKYVGFVPITLANRYDWVPSYCEIRNNGFEGAERRPVLMRGSVGAMIACYSLTPGLNSANGYVAALFMRALKMSRSTFLTYEEYDQFEHRFFKKIREKYRTTGHIWGHVPQFHKYNDTKNSRKAAIVGGKLVSLRESEYKNVRALRDIIKKTERLDERRKLVLAHMHERLAA